MPQSTKLVALVFLSKRDLNPKPEVLLRSYVHQDLNLHDAGKALEQRRVPPGE